MIQLLRSQVLLLLVTLTGLSGCGGRTGDGVPGSGSAGASGNAGGSFASDGGGRSGNGAAGEAPNAGAGPAGASGNAGSPGCIDEAAVCVTEGECCAPYRCTKQVSIMRCFPDCRGLSQEQCALNEKCAPILGDNGDMLRTYKGCHPASEGCDSSTTCALPPGQSAECVRFSNGCLPDGWVESFSCPIPGCPSH